MYTIFQTKKFFFSTLRSIIFEKFGLAWFDWFGLLPCLKKGRRKDRRGKNSRGKDLAGKIPSREKTQRGKDRRGKDLAGKIRRGKDLAPIIWVIELA